MGIGQDRPDRSQIPGTQPGFPGELIQGRLRLSQFGSVLVTPGGQEVVGVVDLMPLVEVDDPPDAKLVAIGIRDCGMRREDETVRHQDQVVGDPSRRRQVFLDQSRRHRQRFARVVEPRLVRRIHGKLSGRPDVDAGQVANRVIELRIAEPVRQDRARVARIPPRLSLAQLRDPVDHRAALVRLRMPLRLFGRHLTRLEPFHDELPDPVSLHHISHRRIAAQIQLGFLLPLAVTAEAVVAQERLHHLRESTLQRRSVRACRDRCQPDQQEPPGEKPSQSHRTRPRRRLNICQTFGY